MRSFIDAVPAQVAVIDETGRIIQVNEAWESFASENGHDGSSFIGANYLDVCAMTEGAEASTAQAVLSAIRSVIDGDKDRFVHHYDCHGPDKMRWFRLEGVRCEGGVALFHIAEAEPHHTDPGIEDFAGALECLTELADDLKVPLNAIIEEAESLVGEGSSESRASCIVRAARALETMIDGAADMDVGFADPLDGEEGLIDVARMVEEALRLTGDLARERGVRVAASVEVLPRLVCNQRRVYQTIVAMLSRAIQATPKGLDVAIEARTNAAQGIEISVQADGACFPEQRMLDGRLRLPGLGDTRQPELSSTELALGLGRLCMESHGGALAINRSQAGAAVTAVFPTWRSRA
ncbi:MAG: hypothetical protein ACPGOV_00210 [Magnetovibrionaceae bacterium]